MLKRLKIRLLKRRALNAFVEGRFQEAYSGFGKILEKDPGNHGMAYNMGLACIALKKFEEAEKCFEPALGKGGGIYRTMGDLYYLWGKRERALEWYEKALGPGGDRELVKARVRICKDEERYKTALASYDLLSRGNEEMKKKKWDRALDLFKEAVEADQTDYIALNNLGTILMNVKKDFTGAGKYFMQADALVDNPVVKGNLRRIKEHLAKGG